METTEVLSKITEALTLAQQQLNYERALREKAENALTEMQPKADVYDVLMGTNKDLRMNEAAKTLNIGRNKLFEFLRNNQIFTGTEPYQKYIDRGYFTVHQTYKEDGYGQTRVFSQTFVTQKGMDFLIKLLGIKVA